MATWQLERLLTGDLETGERQDLQNRVDSDGGLQRRVAALRASNAAILSDYPVRTIAAAVDLKNDEQRRMLRGRVFRFGTMAAGAAALLIGVALPLQRLTPTGGETIDEVTRLKGLESQLLVHRRTSAGSEQLVDGAIAQTDDQLQVSYVAAGAQYGVILSIDGRGIVTLHLPGEGAPGLMSAELRQGAAVSLDHSYQLDDAPSFERFFLLTSGADFSVDLALNAASQLAGSAAALDGNLSLPEEVAQVSFLVEKE